MVGHVSRSGELFFEKAHQILKRGIRQSNHKDIQLLSMTSAIFNDWEARLTTNIKNVFQKEKRAILACFRLLSGREAVSALNGSISEANAEKVIRALGPPHCVPAFLKFWR